MINTKVIIRSNMSGCWFGTLKSLDGQKAEISNARRLWRWWAASGVSLSGVATHGIKEDKKSDCRIAEPVDLVLIFDVVEILSTTKISQQNIENQPVLS